MAIRNDLFKKVQQITNSGLAIMEGRETGDIESILDEHVLVDNYQFGTSKDGEYVAFTIQGNDTEFFFGGSVVTEAFKKLDALLSEEEKIELLTEGIDIYLEEVKSENKRKYKKCTFFKED